MSTTFDIEAGKGFGSVFLGQTIDEVKATQTTNFERKTETFEDESEEVVLRYAKAGVDFFFASEDDFRLSSISFHSNHYKINHQDIIGLLEDELLGQKSKLGLEDLVLEEDDDLFCKEYYSESNELSILLMSGKVVTFTLMPFYTADGTEINWP